MLPSDASLPVPSNTVLPVEQLQLTHHRTVMGAPAIPKDFGFLPIPPWLRYEGKQLPFKLQHNILFAFLSATAFASLTICTPILITLSEELNVDYLLVSKLPAIAIFGCLPGILFICPLGDTHRRRPLFMLSALITSFFTMGLAITDSFAVFAVLTFLAGFASFNLQLAIPYTADLAAENRKTISIAITCSGILLGTTLSRISAGLFDHYTSYRWAYALWAALQLFSAFLCYVALPDYPAKTMPEQREPYWSGTMKGFALAPFKEPVLLQYTLVCMLVFVAYETFWTSTTFFASEVYHLSSLSISLLSLIIFSSALSSPLGGWIGDRLPLWLVAIIGFLCFLGGAVLYTIAADKSLAVVILCGIIFEVSVQFSIVCVEAALQSVAYDVGSRYNSWLGVIACVGRAVGSQGGSEVLLRHGFRANGYFCIGILVLLLAVMFARGPFEDRYTWIGWSKGFSLQKPLLERQSWDAERREREQVVSRAESQLEKEDGSV